jgi:hypothetical protein
MGRGRRPGWVWIGWVVSALPALPQCAAAQSPVLDEAIVRKWREYEQFSRGLQGVKRQIGKLANGKPFNKTSRFRQNRDCVLLRYFIDDPADEVIMIQNPSYSAELRGNASVADRVVLFQYVPDPAAALRSSGGMPLAQAVFVESSPHFSYYWTKLSDLAAKPTFRIKAITKVVDSGRELLRVDHDTVFDEPNKQTRLQGALYLDPGRCWCLTRVDDVEEIYHRGVHARTMKWDIRYETTDHPSGFPLVRASTIRMDGRSDSTGAKVGGEVRCEYEWDVNNRVTDDQFTLSAFGLPEPVGVTREKPTPVYVWLLAAAGGFGALALLFRWLVRRRQAAQAAA